jgi:hypothetical protein
MHHAAGYIKQVATDSLQRQCLNVAITCSELHAVSDRIRHDMSTRRGPAVSATDPEPGGLEFEPRLQPF